MEKILVLEESRDLRHNIEGILKLSGYEVYTAADGRRGVKQTMQLLPDLILCDVLLPELSGFQVLEILKRSNVTQDIPVIFLTNEAGSDDIRKGMSLGADDYLIKPIDNVDLLDAVAARLKKNKKVLEQTDAQVSLFDDARGLQILEELGRNQEVRLFAARERIFAEGDVPRYLYMVKSGRVEIFKTNNHGKELVLDVFSAGDFFGYEDLVFNLPHHDNALAIDNQTRILLIPRSLFLETLLTNRQFSALIIKHLANAIETKEQRMLSIAYDSVRKRIANALIRLSEHAKANGDGVKIFRQDLSNMVGTAKESVSRTLSEFRKEKLIEIRQGKITILNKDRLANLQG
ncbi:MAG: response regulator [Saprospiraceae bacterium]|nr:response regulator [Saprospiraceae bacterium]